MEFNKEACEVLVMAGVDLLGLDLEAELERMEGAWRYVVGNGINDVDLTAFERRMEMYRAAVAFGKSVAADPGVKEALAPSGHQILKSLKASNCVRTQMSGGQTLIRQSHMTLGQLSRAIKQTPEEYKICIGSPHSYRGHYNHIALEPLETDCTVGELDKALDKALSGRVFQGYKGGDYVMSDDTPVWVAKYGEPGDVLTGLHVREDGVVEVYTATNPTDW